MKDIRWIPIVVAALLLAAIVGGLAYNAGVANGIEQSGKIITAPGGAYPPHAWAWHRPWFFSPILVPLLFIFFWMALFRGVCGRGWHHRRYRHLDEWHRDAHERMWNDPSGSGGATAK